MVERDVGGERVDELVLSHERVGKGIEVGFGHFRRSQRLSDKERDLQKCGGSW